MDNMKERSMGSGDNRGCSEKGDENDNYALSTFVKLSKNSLL